MKVIPPIIVPLDYRCLQSLTHPISHQSYILNVKFLRWAKPFDFTPKKGAKFVIILAQNNRGTFGEQVLTTLILGWFLQILIRSWGALLKQARKLQDAQAEKLISLKAKNWQPDKFTSYRLTDHKRTGWQDDKMTRWQDVKMTRWQDDKLTNLCQKSKIFVSKVKNICVKSQKKICQKWKIFVSKVEKYLCQKPKIFLSKIKRHDDMMTWWQDDKMTRWQGDKVTRWQSDKMTRWQDDKMTRWQDDKIMIIRLLSYVYGLKCS